MTEIPQGGPGVLRAFGADAKSYRALALMTKAIVEAAGSGSAVDLEAAFAEDRKAMRQLNNQIRIALGICEVVSSLDKKGRRKNQIVDTLWAAKVFSTWTKTQQTNFAHMLKKSSQAAACVIDIGASVQMDENIGTLVVSGREVAKAFGNHRVVLDERQISGLKRRPSFTALAAIAQERRGIVPRQGSSTRGVRAVESSDTKFEEFCREFVRLIKSTVGVPTPRQSSALRVVRHVIDETIG